jgi:hypothetical protein
MRKKIRGKKSRGTILLSVKNMQNVREDCTHLCMGGWPGFGKKVKHWKDGDSVPDVTMMYIRG